MSSYIPTHTPRIITHIALLSKASKGVVQPGSHKALYLVGLQRVIFVSEMLSCLMVNNSMKGLVTRVHFRWRAEGYEYGDEVRVVGSSAELGNWDVSKGFVLSSRDDAFPCFYSTEPVSLPSRVVVEYKYAVVGPDGSIRNWECRAGNRSISPTGAEMTVEDDGGEFRTRSSESVGTPALPSLSRSKSHEDGFRQKINAIRSLEGSGQRHPGEIVYVVSLNLPVRLVSEGKDWKVISNKAATIPTLHILRKSVSSRYVFVGHPGVEISDYREQQKVRQILLEHDCVPVFIGQKEWLNFSDFCGSVLWPASHGVIPESSKHWAAYQQVNQKYAETVIASAREDIDPIWVHDFHLWLVPMMVSRRLTRSNIGVFLHSPFPPADIFRTLSMRQELLRGLLCADIIGFQFFEYARHFLVSCKRLLGLDHSFYGGGLLSVDYCGRKVHLKIANVGIEGDLLKEKLLVPEINQMIYQLKSKLNNSFVFVGIDRCDKLAGLLLKLRGFRKFLTNHKESRVVLIQLAFFPNLSTESEWTLAQEAITLAREINSEFGRKNNLSSGVSFGPTGCALEEIGPCVRLSIGARISLAQKLSVLAIADCLLDTSLKDGLNITPFELLAVGDGLGRCPVLICSEFSGCSRVLAGALKINPWYVDGMANALFQAFSMSEITKRSRFEADAFYALNHTLRGWADDFVNEIRKMRKPEGKVFLSVGFGAKTQLLGVESRLEHLSIDNVIKAYQSSRNRLILLDNEGTLPSDKTEATTSLVTNLESLHAHGSPPKSEILNILQTLANDEAHNVVVITSGRSKELLSEWFQTVSGQVGLAAEHGFFTRLPTLSGDRWSCLLPLSAIDLSWKNATFELMRHYVKRTQGTFIENKGSALVWQYRDADPEFGGRQAQELSSALQDLLTEGHKTGGVVVCSGKGYVEVKLGGVTKGAVAKNLIERITNLRGMPDFVLCIGDDRSDESMFEQLNSVYDGAVKDGDIPPDLAALAVSRTLSSESVGGKTPAKFMSLQDLGGLVHDDPTSPLSSTKVSELFTVKVGRKKTCAKFYVESPSEVGSLMTALRSAAEESIGESLLTLKGVREGQARPSAPSTPGRGILNARWRPLSDLVFREEPHINSLQ